MFKSALIGMIAIAHLLSMMSVEQKVGEIFLFGFDGTEYNKQIQTLIDNNIRGFIIYRRNVKNDQQLKKLISDIKSKSKDIPSVIAIDQEGGMVARIRSGFVPPNAMALGAINDLKLTYDVGYLTGKNLKRFGIDIDFAPVLDVNSNPMNPVIGVRSFWNTPERVARNGVAFFKGLRDSGIISVGKHFPGHGDTDVDSHLGLPVIKDSEEDFLETHVYPFKIAAEEGIPAIMTAHIIVPFWDKIPATISKRAIDFLRKSLKFDGVIVSDDLLMRAISDNMKIEEAVKEALLAGVDMFIIWKDLKTQLRVYNYIVSEVKNGDIPMDILNKAVERILKMKIMIQKVKTKDLKIDQKKIKSVIPEKAISICKGTFKIDKNKRYIIFFPKNPTAFVVQERIYIGDYLKEILKSEGVKYKLVKYNLKSTPYRYLKYIKSSKDYDGVIVFTIDAFKHRYSSQIADMVVKENPNNLVVAIQSPYDYLFLKNKSSIKAYIVTYDWNEDFAKTLIKKLMDNSGFSGDCILKGGGI